MFLRRTIPILLTMALAACTAAPRQARPPEAGATGLALLAVDLLAGGEMARLNYQVVDLERARRTLQGEVYLKAGDDGPMLAVTTAGRLGALRQRPAAGNRKQFILFTNTGRKLERGDIAILYAGGEAIARVPVT